MWFISAGGWRPYMEDMAAREEKAGSCGRGREGSQAAMHRADLL